jgi:hypothetical protein
MEEVLRGRFGLPEFAPGVSQGAGDIFDISAFPVFDEPFATAWENVSTQLAIVT